MEGGDPDTQPTIRSALKHPISFQQRLKVELRWLQWQLNLCKTKVRVIDTDNADRLSGKLNYSQCGNVWVLRVYIWSTGLFILDYNLGR